PRKHAGVTGGNGGFLRVGRGARKKKIGFFRGPRAYRGELLPLFCLGSGRGSAAGYLDALSLCWSNSPN
ncbi:MAG: hypothetical protein AAGU11_23440, partial [Syntrophobacteraceae bacterium]